MCACRCGIKVHLRDGQIRYIEGNPDHPVNRGVLCAKGSAGIMQHYSPGAPDQPPEADRRAWRLRIPGDLLGRGARHRERMARQDPCRRSAQARLLHRSRPEPGADRLVGEPVRHAELCRPWRLLLGQHGGRRHLHDRRLVLGVRRGGLGPHPLFHAVRLRRGPRQQPDQDRARQAQAARRQDRLDQPGAHRLLGDRRRVAGHHARHRRPVRARAGARAFARRHGRCRLSRPLHQRRLAGGAEPGRGRTTACSCAMPTAGRSCWDRQAAGAAPGGRWRCQAEPQGRGADRRAASGPCRCSICWPSAISIRATAPMRSHRRPASPPPRSAGSRPSSRRPRSARRSRSTVPWTDVWGNRHERMVGRPVSMHAMRGISAHSNGFHTCRALHLLQALLGSIDVPGGFRYKPPFPKPAPPGPKPAGRPGQVGAGPADAGTAARLSGRARGSAGRGRRHARAGSTRRSPGRRRSPRTA